MRSDLYMTTWRALAFALIGVACGPAAAQQWTIKDLAALQFEQRRKEAQALEEKLTPAPAKSDKADAPVAVRPVAPPPVDKIKVVEAIYGPAGAEKADVRLPSGAVITVQPGASVEGFEVTGVAGGYLLMNAPAEPCPSTRLSSGKGRGGQARAPGCQHRPPVRIAVGGRFK